MVRAQGSRLIDEPRVMELLRCPACASPFAREGHDLRCLTGGHRVRIDQRGIPRFTEVSNSRAGRAQERHYDKVARGYLANVVLPQTEVYTAYLDRVLLDGLTPGHLGEVLEICCGQGEGLDLVSERIDLGVGLDVSSSMLAAASSRLDPAKVLLMQADATRIPLEDGRIDAVISLGGVHHVPDRRRLFAEIFRVLRPGGTFVFREPLNDAVLWRGLRSIVYHLSPALDATTERPLRRDETLAELERCGFELRSWRPCALLGFALLMNSDVLVVNRLLRYLPGIRRLTELWTRIDELALALPGLSSAGLQVVGVAERPSDDRQVQR